MPIDPRQKLTFEDLADKSFVDYLEERWGEVILPFEIHDEAAVFLSDIAPVVEDPEFQKKHPQIYDTYSKIHKQAKFLALDSLDIDEIAELLEKSYTYPSSFPEEYDYIGRIRTRLVGMPLYEEQDVAREKWRRALERNAEKLTEKEIIESEKGERGTVGNWLRFYIRNVGSEPTDEAGFETFFTSSGAIRALDVKERGKVRKLFELYAYLKLSSMSPEGLPERVPGFWQGKFVIFDEGRLEEVSGEVERLYQQFAKAFPDEFPVAGSEGGVVEAVGAKNLKVSAIDAISSWQDKNKDKFEQIYKSESEVLGEIQQKHEKVREVLWDAAGAKDLVKSMAALKVLAKMGALQEIFTREDVMKLFSPYIERKFGQAARMSFAKNPNRPQYVAALLRYVLEEKLGLSENEASLWATLVLRLLETQDPAYARAVFFDEKSGEFKWNPEMSAVGTAK